MASGKAKVNGVHDYLSPLATVSSFFDSLAELRTATGHGSAKDEKLLVACEGVNECGERVIKCLEQRIRQENRASELSQEVLGAFQLGLRRLIQLKGEVEELRKTVKELNLAEQGLDSRTIGSVPSTAPSTTSTLTTSLTSSSTSLQSLQDKRRSQRDFVIPGSTSAPIPRASSYENFLQHKELTLSSGKKTTESSAGGGSIRKAKSEPDVGAQTLRKKIDTLTIDNERLKTTEKTLIKKNIKLTRNCKALEKERDMAEDRLKIEQTQRDSIEKLRQRNKELEEQLRQLCDSQVIREREAAKDQETADQPSPTHSQPQEEQEDTAAE